MAAEENRPVVKKIMKKKKLKKLNKAKYGAGFYLLKVIFINVK